MAHAPAPEHRTPSTDRTLEQFRARPTDRTRAHLLEAAQEWSFPVAFGVLRQREDAEDVAQEVLLELLEVLPTLRDTEHLRRWTYRASLHEAIDHRRRKLRRMKRETDRELAPEPDEPEFDSEDALALHTALAQLDDDAQEVLIGYFFEGNTLAQLAGRRSCSTTHVWNQIERGKSALARRLERAGFTAAAPLCGSWLEAMPPAPPTPPVAAEVLVRAQALSSASPAAASALGVFFMTVTTKTSVTLVAVGVLAFALGLGAESWFAADRRDPTNDRSTARERSTPSSTSEVDTSEWEATIAALREENAKLTASLAAANTAEPAEESTAPGVAADPLTARLASLLEWMTVKRAEAEAVEAGGDPQEMEAFFKAMTVELRTHTNGLRDLMVAQPEVLLAFLDRADVDDDFIALTFDTLIPKQRGPNGSYRIETEGTSALPVELIDGIFHLCEESNARLKNQALATLLQTAALEDQHLETLRQWIDHPDPEFASTALRVFQKHAEGRSDAYDEALQNTIQRTLRETHPDQHALVSASISALQDIETPAATALLLELLETGRYSRQDLTVIYALTNRASSFDPSELSTYHHALIAAAGRVPSAYPSGADPIVQSALRLRAIDAIPILEALVPRVDTGRAELLRGILDELGSKDVSTSVLWDRYQSAVRR